MLNDLQYLRHKCEVKIELFKFMICCLLKNQKFNLLHCIIILDYIMMNQIMSSSTALQ